MARLSRLTLPGQLHVVLQRGHPAAPVFVDAVDVDGYLNALHDVARERRVPVHAFGFSAGELRLLVTPPDADALSRLMQSVSRRHAAWLHRRHGRSGTPWQGRFASAPVEAAAGLFDVMRFVEMADDASALQTSEEHHRGATVARGLVDPAGYWSLGNTPFDRESAYGRLADQPLSAERVTLLRSSALNGWPIGSPAFGLAAVGALPRAQGPGRRGRPRKAADKPPPALDKLSPI